MQRLEKFIAQDRFGSSKKLSFVVFTYVRLWCSQRWMRALCTRIAVMWKRCSLCVRMREARKRKERRAELRGREREREELERACRRRRRRLQRLEREAKTQEEAEACAFVLAGPTSRI
eukprot:6180380-Pleurochrysis_carterae.AAC.1